ncbi:hypothetical protein LCL95_16030 [Bacillus timonensis]|nr:hypothetical protein [Bacillus timonensis]
MVELNVFRDIYFHDSILEGINYLENENKLILEIELCNWKQKWFNSDESEMRMGHLVFRNVIDYEIDPHSMVDSNEVLEIEVNKIDKKYYLTKLVLTLEDDVMIIKIKASDVEWIWL